MGRPSLESQLRSLDANLAGAIEALTVPAYVVDATGQIRWLNDAARQIVGDAVGRAFTDVVAAADRGQARTVFTQKLLGTATATDVELALVAADGHTVSVEISSAAIGDDGRTVGVFGLARPVAETPAPAETPSRPALTARQLEVLRLLARGRTTDEIASQLGVSRETVRNHVRTLLRGLDAHSRLEAVLKAASRGLVQV